MLERLTSPFKEFGIPAGFLYVIDRLLSRLSPSLRLYVYELMIQPIPPAPILPARISGNLDFREIERDDPALERIHIRKEIIDSRFNQGALCLGAFKEQELVGYIWFSFETYLEDEVRCTFILKPSDESVFDFDLFLFPKYRLGFGFVSLWDGANEFLRNRGIRYTYSRLTRFNTPSRRAHAHLGWKRVARCLFLKMWNVEIMCATVFPYLHASFRTAGRVRLNMTPDALIGSSNSQ